MNLQIKKVLSLLVIALFLGACGGGGSSSSNAGASGGDTTAGGTATGSAATGSAAGDAAPAQDTIVTAAGSQVRGEAGIEGLEVPDQVTVIETR